MDLWIVEGALGFRFRNFIFWPYQALPGLTGLDKRRPVTRVTGVASLHGCTANELIGLVG